MELRKTIESANRFLEHPKCLEQILDTRKSFKFCFKGCFGTLEYSKLFSEDS